MNIYLDINGTILHRKLFQVKTANYLREFLQNVLKKHDVYWLSTMCEGNKEEVIAYLSNFFAPDLLDLAFKVKPTYWKRYKVEAIDLEEEFLWFDDIITEYEEKVLSNAGKLDSYVQVKLYENEDFFRDWLEV